MRKRTDEFAHSRIYAFARSRMRGFTFTELIMVVLIVSLLVLLAMLNLGGLLGKNTFRARAQELVSTMQMTASTAAESDRRYEVIIDITEQGYLLRQITTPDLSQVLEEEIIVENYLSDNCRVDYVLFDDGEYANEGRAKFRAGHSGWAYGGKIVLLDENEQPYSVVVNRLNRTITLEEGDVELLEPKPKDELPF
ncbi:MAG: prepilin-type N-terminal cleavage/methylation domain-containing protein [Phycisphaerales bacterium]|jgi:prepilin-type N-terminal cleavage/methylation domain-containing protein